jgi:hypothetical protein
VSPEISVRIAIATDELRPEESPQDLPFDDNWLEVDGLMSADYIEDDEGPTIFLNVPTGANADWWVCLQIPWDQFCAVMRIKGFDVTWDYAKK